MTTCDGPENHPADRCFRIITFSSVSRNLALFSKGRGEKKEKGRQGFGDDPARPTAITARAPGRGLVLLHSDP